MNRLDKTSHQLQCTRRQLISGFGSAAVTALLIPTISLGNDEKPISTRHYVLIHGAWHGAWAWKKVAAGLNKIGHNVSTPTLTGLGERAHLLHSDIGLKTHVQDIVSHLEMEDLKNVILVGHSYAGMVISGVLGEKTQRIKSVVYFDAFLPEIGKALSDYVPEEAKAQYEKLHAEKKPVLPPPVHTWGDRWGLNDPEMTNWVNQRIKPQSALTFLEPVTKDYLFQDINYVYMRCENNPNPLFSSSAIKIKKDSRWKYKGINSHHEAMMLNPEMVVTALTEI